MCACILNVYCLFRAKAAVNSSELKGEPCQRHLKISIVWTQFCSLHIWEPVTKFLQLLHLVIRPSTERINQELERVEQGAKAMFVRVLLKPHAEGNVPRPGEEYEPAFESWLVTNYLCA